MSSRMSRKSTFKHLIPMLLATLVPTAALVVIAVVIVMLIPIVWLGLTSIALASPVHERSTRPVRRESKVSFSWENRVLPCGKV